MNRWLVSVLIVGLAAVACNSSGPVVTPDSGTPVVDSGAPIVDSGAPVVDSGAPVVDSGAPVVDSGPPIVDAGAPIVDAGAPIVDAGAPIVDSGPPVVDSGPPVVDAGAPGGCPPPNPQGCVDDSDCAGHWICDRRPCWSSNCHCDEIHNVWACTEDCGGGICADPAGYCGEDDTPARSGCTQFGCPDGLQCVRAEGECSPSSCVCSLNGIWMCTRDCGGGGTCQRP
jgi:hypothetical protein